jgi:hypothetical protein
MSDYRKGTIIGALIGVSITWLMMVAVATIIIK